MDPATVAASVVSILAPYFADAGKEVLKAGGEAGLQKVKTLLGWLKQRFADDPSAAKDLARFEQNPQAFTPSLQATIEERLRDDPAFAAEIRERIAELGPVISVVQRFREFNNVTAVDVDAIRSGQVSVRQEGDTATNSGGVRAKTIG